jgi:D-lactate dehydrogenase (cytochrome)
MAATRASGTTAVRYGTMKENVLALEVVLADGRIIRTGSRARKSSAGYDLTKLMVGSEGTLGIITELTLKLQGQPEAISAATCAFPDVESAVNTVITTIQSGIPMARMELIDANMVRGFNIADGTDLPEKPHLFIEFHGSKTGVAEQAEAFGELAGDFGADAFKWASKPEDRSALWKMRHNAFYAIKALAPGLRALSTDICVPISRLTEAINFAIEQGAALGLPTTVIGHVGDGNFHCALSFDPDDAAEFVKVNDFLHRLAQQALALNGTVTGEHGIGIGKMKYMEEEHGAALDVMRAIKQALDPQGLLNPGKMLPPSNR